MDVGAWFVRGVSQVNAGFAVGFGFSVRFRDSKAFRGTLRYAEALVKPVRA